MEYTSTLKDTINRTRQGREQLLNKDLQALQQASAQLPFQTKRLEREMDTIKQDMAPKVEDIKEITPKEDPIDFRRQAVENIKAQEQNLLNVREQNDTQVQTPTEHEGISIPTTDNQPFSDILPQEHLNQLILKKAQQYALEAGKLAQQSENAQIMGNISSGLDNLLSSEATIGPVQNRVSQSQNLLPDDFSKQAGSKWQHGFQFRPRNSNDLSGQCGWYAQQFTTLQNGKNWTIGSKISDKKEQFAQHAKNGDAFYLGKDVPQVGNSIIFNGGKWGHVAVISKINQDGTAVLDESNYNNDQRVTKNRVISLSDPSIIGFLRTKIAR